MRRLFYQLLTFVLTIVVVIESERDHQYAHGPFGKAHLSVNLPNPFNCNRTIGLISRLFPMKSLRLTELQVSKVNYSNADQLTVTWTPIENPCKDDFIGVYFVEVPVTTGACDYADFEFVTATQTTSTWTMINLRRQLEFRFYSREKCMGPYQFIAKSPVVQPSNENEPTQVHLALGDQIDQMYVSYVTNSSAVVPQCQYGLSPSSLTSTVSGTSTTYNASNMCEGKANLVGPQNFIHPGYMHTMLMNDLRPSTTYYYRVGSNEHGWSSIYEFINRQSSKDDTVNLVAYGDMGLSPIQSGAKRTIDRVFAKAVSTNATAVLHIGDISYARGTGVLWDGFMTQIEPTTSRIAYMTGIGNHEYDHVTGGQNDPSHAPGPGGFRPTWGDYGTDSGGECAIPMVYRFHSPSNGNGLFWYSFDIGPIHVVYYSTEHDFLSNSSQYAWLEKDLASVDRSRTPWLIVGGHRPMYSSFIGTDLIREKLQEYIEPLFYKYHVDLHLFAHIHSYERSCKMFANKCVEDGITNVLIGMGGHDLSNGTYAQVDWSIYRDIAFGYTHLVVNKTHLEFTYHHSNDDVIHDHFILNK